MKLCDYAFIVMAPHYDPVKHRAVFGSSGFRTTIVGVASLDMACEVASDLVSQGTQLIELCGAFDEEAARVVADAIDGAVPVGFMAHSPQDVERYCQLKPVPPRLP